MIKTGFRKPLFEVESKELQKKNKKQEDVELVETTKKRRSRPKKNTLVHTTKKESPKSGIKIGESKKSVVEKKPTGTLKPDKGWKDFKKSRPEPLRPCDFYVVDEKDKRYEFRGYVRHHNGVITDHIYELAVIGKRTGNIFYRELPCENVSNCPNEFPRCETCKQMKKSGGKKLC